MAAEKVVITGCGVVASNATGREEFAAALAEGRSGIGELTAFDASDTGRERAAEAQDFDAAPFLRSPKNYLDRNSALAFAACEMAVRESGLSLPDPCAGYGLSVGSMAGNLESLAAFAAKVREKGARFAPPFLFPHTYYNTTAGLLSIEYGLTGPHGQFCSGGAAGLEAAMAAADCVQLGRAGMMVAGGVEAFSEWLFRACLARGWLSPAGSAARQLAPHCEESCRPFSPDRNGAILGEGAAFFVFEPETAAQARGAHVLARVLGRGAASSCNEAMSAALASAGTRPGSIGAVFASAGGYALEDEEEAAAIRGAGFGPQTAIVALKGLIGETLGAAGALNLAAALVVGRRGRALSALKVDCLSCGNDAGEGGNHEPENLTGEREDRTFLVNAGSPGTGRWVSVVLKIPIPAP